MMEGWDGDLDEFVDLVEKEINEQIRIVTRRGFERILERTPVQSGRLKAGWALRINEGEGLISSEIENLVPYAGDVEYGGPNRPANPIIEITAQEMVEEFDIL